MVYFCLYIFVHMLMVYFILRVFFFFLVNSAMDLYVMTSLKLDWPHIVYFYFNFDRNL